MTAEMVEIHPVELLDEPFRHADGRFAIVHHPLAPRALAAPLHYHHNEDEFSFVLSGR